MLNGVPDGNHKEKMMMGGDDLTDVLHDDWAISDEEVLTEDEDAANPSESGEETDWRIY